MNKTNTLCKLPTVSRGLILLLLFASPMLITPLTEGRTDRDFATRGSQERVESTREFRKEKFPACKTEVMSDEVFVKFNKPLSPEIVQALISQTLIDRRLAQRTGFRHEAVGTSESLYLIHIDGSVYMICWTIFQVSTDESKSSP